MEKNQFAFTPSWNPPPKYKDLTPKEYANELLAFSLKYRAIFEGRMIRFFLDQLWQSIPHEWHAALVECPYEHYLDLYEHVREDWPESLKQFLNEARDLSMPRDIAPELLIDKPDFNEIYGMDAFATGMRDKKLHEVEILSKLIHNVNDTCQIDTLIDIGAGKGYVCNVLEYLYNYHVIAVEGNDCHAQRADARSAKVQRHLYLRQLQQKYGEDAAQVRAGMKEFHEKPSHVTTYFLKYNETDVKDFDYVIEESYKQFSEQNSKNTFSERDTALTPATRIGLISLHGCGDLSCTLLDLFMNWSRAESLVCVPCCFNKLKERPDGSVTAFPLSSWLQGRVNSARTLGLVDCATESTAQWAQGNTQDVIVRLATAQHRAILESAFRHFVPDQSLVFCVKKTRQKSHFADFNRYLNYAFTEQRLKIAVQVNGKSNARGPFLPEEIIPNWAEIRPEIVTLAERLHAEHARDDKAMLAYCTLQVVLAPVLESLIVIDRYLYLTERGVTCQVLPVFDAATSPRNLAIIARKNHRE